MNVLILFRLFYCRLFSLGWGIYGAAAWQMNAITFKGQNNVEFRMTAQKGYTRSSIALDEISVRTCLCSLTSPPPLVQATRTLKLSF